MKKKIVGTAFMVAILASCQAMGADAPSGVPGCTGVSDAKSRSRPYFKGETMMTALLVLEGKGERHFHLEPAPPASQCVFEKFEVAGTAVEGIVSPFEKSPGTTLHWRFHVGGADARDILVMYDGTASVLAEKEMFFVAEERKGSISYYAMFRDQPTYAVLKPLVTSILDGSAPPLATVRWPAGAKEPVIDAYDAKRLK